MKCAFFGLLLVSAPLSINAQSPVAQDPPPAAQATQSATAKGKVQDIDYANRTVTLKVKKGKVFTVKVGEGVRNLNQIRKGDQVTIHYQESVALGIHKTTEVPSHSEQHMLLTAHAKPAADRINTAKITGTVTSINRYRREIAVRLPQGKTRTLKVGKEIETFDHLQTGDQVVATYTDAFAINVTRSKT
jgi:Cu/Ag efflux protein CusF